MTLSREEQIKRDAIEILEARARAQRPDRRLPVWTGDIDDPERLPQDPVHPWVPRPKSEAEKAIEADLGWWISERFQTAIVGAADAMSEFSVELKGLRELLKTADEAMQPERSDKERLADLEAKRRKTVVGSSGRTTAAAAGSPMWEAKPDRVVKLPNQVDLW